MITIIKGLDAKNEKKKNIEPSISRKDKDNPAMYIQESADQLQDVTRISGSQRY